MKPLERVERVRRISIMSTIFGGLVWRPNQGFFLQGGDVSLLSSSKGLKILNLGDNAQGASGVAAALEASDDEGVDPHLNRIRIARGAGDGGGDDSDEEVHVCK